MKKTQLKYFLSPSFLVILVLNACAPGTPIPTPKPTGVRFESAACMFGELNGVDCGYLYVPEDHTQPKGTELQLAVAIIRSSNPNPAPDPVLLLFRSLGGPGIHALEFTEGFMVVLKEVLATRDAIVFDQRGTGFSPPSLNCPEVDSQALQDAPQNLSEEELQRHIFQAYQACHERLAQKGIDLSAYTVAADAADINDLRTALGYTEWNIYGDSYATRLAQTVMRDYPEGVRSVVLDSVYPLQANSDIEAAVNADRALKLLFERCAADEACNADYPDLETVFYDAAEQLDFEPVSLEVVSQETREKVKVLINGDRLINLIIHMLNFTDVLPYIPGWIYKFYEGTADSDFMLEGYMYFFAYTHEISSEGKAISVQCNDGINSSSAQSIEEANAGLSPRLQAVVNQGRYLSLCSAWDAEPGAEIASQPVVSDIPTLLVTGDSDPQSPPAWALSTAENLSNSYYFEIPWASHGLSYGPSSASKCARSIVSAFITDPTAKPNSACIDKLVVTFVRR